MEKTVKRDLVIGVLVTIAYAIAGTMFGESVSNVMSYVLIMTCSASALICSLVMPV